MLEPHPPFAALLPDQEPILDRGCESLLDHGRGQTGREVQEPSVDLATETRGDRQHGASLRRERIRARSQQIGHTRPP